jgi:hypothetical protein
MKITGKEWKEFLSAKVSTWWDKVDAVSFNITLEVNGVETDDWDDIDIIRDTDKLVVHGETSPEDLEECMSISKAISNWRKTKTHSTIIFDVANKDKEAVLQYLYGVKCKIFKTN